MFHGFGYVFTGIKLLFKPKLRRFVFVPLLINVVLFSIAFYLLGHFGQTWIAGKIGQKADWWKWFQFLYDFIVPIISFFLYIILILFVYFSFTLLANIICAPFNSVLAKMTESYLLGEKVNYQELPLMHEIAISIWQEIIKTSRLIIYALPILLLAIIPAVNVIFPFVWFVFISYALSIQYIDYPMSNHGLFYTKQIQIVKRHRASCFGFGIMANLLLFIPVVNFIAMPACVIGATVWWVNEIKPKVVN